MQRAAQNWMSGHLAASALIKRTRPCDCPKSLTAIRFPVELARPTKARAREVGARMMTGRKFLSPPSWRSLRNPIMGAPRARNLSFFPIWPAAVLFRAKLARPTKSTRAESCATTDDRAQFSQPPPLLWLAPQSDHGSAACAETEAFFQYGPPQSFFELSWLALQKARAREAGANFYAPPLMARSAIRSWECRVRGN